MELMQSLGFVEVYDLQGGIVAWEKAGLPLSLPVSSNGTNGPAATSHVYTTVPSDIQDNKPATFSISNLGTDPPVPIPPSALFSFLVTVTNEGNVEGYYDAIIELVEVIGELRLEIGAVSESVTVPPGQSRIITFEQIHLTQGVYEASIEKENLLFECT